MSKGTTLLYACLTVGTFGVYCVAPFFSHYGDAKDTKAKVMAFHNAGECTTRLGADQKELCTYYEKSSLEKLYPFPTMDKCTDYSETCQEQNGSFKPIPFGFATIQYIGEDGTVGPVADSKPLIQQQWGPLSTCFGKVPIQWGEQVVPVAKLGPDLPTKP
ncbi:MAG: hypothetical protein AB7E52_09225, partial [Bdellovibrionales bacterium]